MVTEKMSAIAAIHRLSPQAPCLSLSRYLVHLASNCKSGPAILSMQASSIVGASVSLSYGLLEGMGY